MEFSERPYNGPERRRFRVFITQNTEYHLERDICVAVRDRKTQAFVKPHLALGRRLRGAVRFRNGTAIPCLSQPKVGEALYFVLEREELVTSVVCGIERPAKQIVMRYRRAS